MSDDLVAFLLARIAEDEQRAQALVTEIGHITLGPVDRDGQPSSAAVVVPGWVAGDAGGIIGRFEAVVTTDSRSVVIRVSCGPDDPEARHVAAHIALSAHPARVLAECEAKRAIVELHTDGHDCPEIHTGVYPPDWLPRDASYGSPGAAWRHASSEHFEDGACPTLRLLTLPYSAHPDYRPEWAPEADQRA